MPSSNHPKIEDINFDDIPDLPEENFDLEDEDAPKPIVKQNPISTSVKDKKKERSLGEFQNSYTGYMDLYSDSETVKRYLNAHQGWFQRCALPMKTDRLTDNGYALTIGKLGAFNFAIEPKIGLHLIPADQEGCYKIETVPIPNHSNQGYEVDFKAVMEMLPKIANMPLPPKAKDLTSVEWHLDLTVYLHFPQFIQGMPRTLIEKTGDAILAQAVRQISRQLTTKVQADFHQTIGLEISNKRK